MNGGNSIIGDEGIIGTNESENEVVSEKASFVKKIIYFSRVLHEGY